LFQQFELPFIHDIRVQAAVWFGLYIDSVDLYTACFSVGTGVRFEMVNEVIFIAGVAIVTP
jgi:hypothetical protein